MLVLPVPRRINEHEHVRRNLYTDEMCNAHTHMTDVIYCAARMQDTDCVIILSLHTPQISCNIQNKHGMLFIACGKLASLYCDYEHYKVIIKYKASPAFIIHSVWDDWTSLQWAFPYDNTETGNRTTQGWCDDVLHNKEVMIGTIRRAVPAYCHANSSQPSKGVLC